MDIPNALIADRKVALPAGVSGVGDL